MDDNSKLKHMLNALNDPMIYFGVFLAILSILMQQEIVFSKVLEVMINW